MLPLGVMSGATRLWHHSVQSSQQYMKRSLSSFGTWQKSCCCLSLRWNKKRGPPFLMRKDLHLSSTSTLLPPSRPSGSLERGFCFGVLDLSHPPSLPPPIQVSLYSSFFSSTSNLLLLLLLQNYLRSKGLLCLCAEDVTRAQAGIQNSYSQATSKGGMLKGYSPERSSHESRDARIFISAIILQVELPGGF